MLKQNQDPDDDSDAEKLSPLLDPLTNEQHQNVNKSIQNSALHMDGVDESIDDTDTDAEELVEVSTLRSIVWALVFFIPLQPNPKPFVHNTKFAFTILTIYIQLPSHIHITLYIRCTRKNRHQL